MPRKKLLVAPELVTITADDLEQVKADIKMDIDKHLEQFTKKSIWATFFSDKFYSVCAVVKRTFKSDGTKHRKSGHANNPSMLNRMRDKMASYFTNSGQLSASSSVNGHHENSGEDKSGERALAQ